ncbi:hypothetical protein A3SI_03920 [Nitritalea halalkaliphila LW7]|uniref:Uncharacterized protein n=1 Tax=Nitritalea halalkaliphila LW7 TaxID=1189621 RepID=I5C988_9BACT|nr:hypothetical protein A3SI_03920 [Nitritalea halalkaliphila LW7]
MATFKAKIQVFLLSPHAAYRIYFCFREATTGSHLRFSACLLNPHMAKKKLPEARFNPFFSHLFFRSDVLSALGTK